jgi:paraquat-inducible protein B
MSRKANPALVGAFVVSAVAIALVALVFFGAADLWRDKLRAVLYFQGSVRGLNVGSAVLFRGVQVGRVVEIRLQMDPVSAEALIPVLIELDPGVVEPSRVVEEQMEPEEALALLLERGLKGRLETQSLLTGLLLIELDLHPDEPARFVGFEHRHVEIPTLPTVLQLLTEELEKLDLKKLAADLNGTMDGLNRLINSPDLEGSLSSLRATLDHYDALAGEIETEMRRLSTAYVGLAERIGDRVDPTADEIDGVLDEARATLASARATIEAVERRVSDEDGIFTSIDEAAEAAGRAAGNAGALLGENSYVVRELQTALRELGLAARSLRQLAETLERRPEALLRGK